MRITKAISEELELACKEELLNEGIRGENGRRLQAIISAKKYGVSQVAKTHNISRETLMRWISRFKAEGVAGFGIRSGRGRRYKLSEEQQSKIKEYIGLEGARLTWKKLQFTIKQLFGVEISRATAHRLLKRLGFSYITARPMHYKQDLATQEEFKKKSRAHA
jgi:transposase